MTQKQYHLTWEIDIWADSPEDAAKEARGIQLDFESASTFDVREFDSDGPTKRITVRDDVVGNDE